MTRTRAPREVRPPSRRERNPKASPDEHREVVRIASRLAGEIDPNGRAAVVLVGSWARGEAHEASDIDLWVVGRRGRHRTLERGGRMVSVKFSTVPDERKEMRNPGRLDGAIPGWQGARILRDPRGVAARLKSEARRFRWSSLRRARDAYLADQVAELGEEVAKLLRALETGERETASVQRNLLANRMAFLRVLPLERPWGTENGLWERAGRWAGANFRAAQSAALGTDGGTWEASCDGALRLYALTARANLRVLRGDTRRVVAAMCRRAGYPIDGGRTERR